MWSTFYTAALERVKSGLDNISQIIANRTNYTGEFFIGKDMLLREDDNRSVIK